MTASSSSIFQDEQTTNNLVVLLYRIHSTMLKISVGLRIRYISDKRVTERIYGQPEKSGLISKFLNF
jgi:hypothetical protein